MPERDLTSGSITGNILHFSLPYLLSYLLQTLYGLADLFIIGQFAGVEHTTAVSIGSQVMHMLTVMLVGLAMGSTVMIGRAVGAKDEKTTALAVGNTATMFFVLSLIAAGLLLLFTDGIVALIATPQEAVADTRSYLTICFIGVPFITAYNIIASVFRGMGDTRSPMYFVAVACVCNIILDYILIGSFGLGATGAALGTTISQAISVGISIVFIRWKKMLSGIVRQDFLPRRDIMERILSIGLPVALQDGFIQVSFLVITVFANRRGLSDAAAVGIVEKLIGILFLVPSSMLSSVSAISAQNIGAGKHDRADETLKIAVKITVCFGLLAAVSFQFLSAGAVALFTSDPSVILYGEQYMRGYVWDCIFAGIHFCFSGYFCAYDRSGISFLHNVISIVCARIPLAYLAAVYATESLFPMGLAAPTGSILSIAVCVIAYRWMKREAI